MTYNNVVMSLLYLSIAYRQLTNGRTFLNEVKVTDMTGMNDHHKEAIEESI